MNKNWDNQAQHSLKGYSPPPAIRETIFGAASFLTIWLISITLTFGPPPFLGQGQPLILIVCVPAGSIVIALIAIVKKRGKFLMGMLLIYLLNIAIMVIIDFTYQHSVLDSVGYALFGIPFWIFYFIHLEIF